MKILTLILACFFTLSAQNLSLVKGEVILLTFPKNGLIKIQSNNKNINFFTHPKDESKVIALIAMPYKKPENKIIQAIYTKGETQICKITYQNGNYQQETLQVAHNKISPPKEVQKRIQTEFQEANKIYQTFTPELLIQENFIKPIDSVITSDFGKARIYNNTLKSYHSGTDFRAPTGTPIYAANSGIVKIAKDRYYAGKSVVIDHGKGIFSQYYHLLELKVTAGQKVKKGELIGLSGSSGRVTGPHLHFGILVNNTQVNPLDFIEKFNALYE